VYAIREARSRGFCRVLVCADRVVLTRCEGSKGQRHLEAKCRRQICCVDCENWTRRVTTAEKDLISYSKVTRDMGNGKHLLNHASPDPSQLGTARESGTTAGATNERRSIGTLRVCGRMRHTRDLCIRGHPRVCLEKKTMARDPDPMDLKLQSNRVGGGPRFRCSRPPREEVSMRQSPVAPTGQPVISLDASNTINRRLTKLTRR